MLGKLEELILIGAICSGDGSSAADIHGIVCDRAGVEKSFGAVWTTLSRMEDKKYLRTEMKVTQGSRRGKPRKLFTVTGLGRTALNENLSATQSLLQGTGLVGEFAI